MAEQPNNLELDLVEVKGVSLANIACKNITQEEATSLVGASYDGNFQNHNHCQYSRCVTRSF